MGASRTSVHRASLHSKIGKPWHRWHHDLRTLGFIRRSHNGKYVCCLHS
uniref:Uncharacterized protein n=1 Tax=Anguilla anguilla TaxID=7936 RepID=A0A0E9UCC5_ANGAN